jgi:hypothetical protein
MRLSSRLFEGNILQHVANRRILHVEGLHPVLKGGGQLAGRPTKLL